MSNVEINSKGGGTTSIFIILLLGLGLSLFYVNKYRTKYNNELKNTTELSRSINILEDSAKTYQIKLNKTKKWVAETEDISVKSNNIEKLYNNKVQELKKLKIKLNQTNTISDISTITQDSIIEIPIYIDSLQQLQTVYNDGYLSLKNTIKRNGTSTLLYQYTDSFTIINAVKQKHFLFFKWGKKITKSYLISKNPKTKISNFKVIQRIE